MNPWPVARAALRRGWRTAVLLGLLVALAVALGTGVSVLERGIRRGAAAAADPFDLLVGALGSPTQLVLTAVYLQPDTVPLLPGAVLARVMAEPQAAWASPIGFGDQWRGHPVVGVAPAFLTQGGRRAAVEGRMFEAENEAVVGAAVAVRLGDTLTPQHGRVAVAGAHTHEDVAYSVVGRLPHTGGPWDRAVLVPIESVWEVHGLGNGHAAGTEQVGPPWDSPPPVPAVAVGVRNVAGAYQLRARYRAGPDSTAVFPGEVLAALFRTLGDVGAVLSGMAAAAAALVLVAVFLAFAALASTRRREHAVLRALGAPPAFIVAASWLELAVVLGGGVAAGLALGWIGAALAGDAVARSAGTPVAVSPGLDEVALAGAVLLAGLVAAAVPALLSSRAGPGAELKR